MEYQMISADDHIDLGYLPSDLWTKRLPSALRERGPQVVQKDGGDFWVCDGQLWGDWRGGAWWSKQKNQGLIYAQDRGGVAEDYVLRPTIPTLRLADMDRDGVQASVMFGPILPMAVGDPELRNACVRAYNDWLAEFCAAAPDRFIGVGMISYDDPAAAKDEVLRLAEIQAVPQVNFLVGTVTPAVYSDEAWEPFWAAAEETGMMVSYHVGGGPAVGDRPGAGARPHKPGAFRYGGPTSFFAPFAGLFEYGVLERHSRLRFIMAESGTGWIPAFVQGMDHSFKKVIESRGRENAALKLLPTEVFKRQVWATYQEDRVGLDLVEFYGAGHMMWASDYPHPDSTWPNSRRIVEEETAHLPADTKRKIIYENARELYGL